MNKLTESIYESEKYTWTQYSSRN